MIRSFGSMMIGGSPFDSRILLYCCDNSRCVSETYDCLDSWIAWSFSELQEGKWLSHSPWNEPLESRRNLEGKPIAGGYRGILIAHRGDEKALAKTFHVRKTWVSQQVCFTCFASRMTDSPYLYTAFGKHAPHRSTLLDLFDFVTTMCDANAFVRVPGFHPAMVLYDWLHVVDLSLTPECSASVFSLHSSGIDFQIDFDFFGDIATQALIEIISCDYGIWQGSNPEERLKSAYVEFCGLCKQHKIRFLALSRTCFFHHACNATIDRHVQKLDQGNRGHFYLVCLGLSSMFNNMC